MPILIVTWGKANHAYRPDGIVKNFDCCRLLKATNKTVFPTGSTGKQREVQQVVHSDRKFERLIREIQEWERQLLRPSWSELIIGISCRNGRHRSVAVGEHLVSVLKEARVCHLDL